MYFMLKLLIQSIANIFTFITFILNGLTSIIKKKTPSIKRLNSLYKLHKKNPSKAGFEFEILMRDHLLNIGFKADLAMDRKKQKRYPKEFLKKGFDGGIDVIAEDSSRIILIQTKFYGKSKKVDGADIGKTTNMGLIYQDYLNSIGDKRKLILMVVTNVSFDSTALIHAKRAGVSTMDGEQLVRYLSNDKKQVKKQVVETKKSIEVFKSNNKIAFKRISVV